MKNFKKVLALVLVVATLMGFATVAGAAYKDADKIDANYTEAVKVLELIETMQGYPDGTFGPKKTITREEAAKLIAIFDNKDSDISTYYTSINPFADEKGRWGESYVGYGYRAGIIAGMNATTYAPTANVTGTQFLKMALVTLGYDQEAEGFVGASWAVNVLALAKRLGLTANLADGWKPENDLTREEAAQILLDTLKCDTVEYGQEAKAKEWNPEEQEDKEGNFIGFTFKGKLYLTVAGAVKTGNKLYKDFKLEPTTSYDAFERPYTKWTYDGDDDKTVEIMKAPKATFTKTFNACELLVALGVKESDTKTTKTIGDYFVNGDDADVESVLDSTTLQHGKNPCHLKDHTEYGLMGAQGTLTQVFKMEDGTYRICSIDTWLAKVEKVSKSTTSRDDHKKGTDSVLLNVFSFDNADGDETAQVIDKNHEGYCEDYCGKFDTADEYDGKDYLVSYDDPTGLSKGDYVLVTYSFKDKSATDDADMGIQSADVVTAKEGRLSGYKYANVAEDPSETRIDSTYVTDAVHFHLGYDDSKDTANFGTKGFFYDAYGNVIGMKDTADTSKYTVIDRAWVTFEGEGEAVLYANVVDLNGTVTKKVVVKDFKDAPVGDEASFLKAYYGKYTIADILADWDGSESYKSFYGIYDMLLKTSVNSKSEYTFEDDINFVSDDITIVKGKPYVTVDGEQIKTTSKTQYLIRTGYVGEGKYEAATGYQNVKSLTASGCDIKMDDKNEYAEIVYVYGSVSYTDGKFVAYVPADATEWKEEVEADGDVYYILTVYVDGVERQLKISDTDKETIEDNDGGFYKFRNVDINEVTTAELVRDSNDDPVTDFNLADTYEVVSYKDGVLAIADDDTGDTFGDTDEYVMALAGDCKVYSVRYDGNKVVAEELDYLDDVLTAGRDFYADWSDNNADNVNKIVAIYVVETEND